MKVKVLSSTVISQSQYEANVREVPLTIFDRLALDIHIAVLFAFKPPNASNSSLIEGLVKTLFHFPTLGAQLGENEHHIPCLLIGHHGGGGGVLVVESEVQANLVDHLPLGPSPDITKLHPSVKKPSHLLQLQLNRFACGGLVIGVTANHRIADGFSMSSFFIEWGKAVRGLEISGKGFYDMQWLKPRIPPRCDFDHWRVEFLPHHEQVVPTQYSLPSLIKTEWDCHVKDVDVDKIDNILVRYSSSFIKEKLKARVSSTYSRFEVLMGHIWRKTTQARGLEPHVSTMLRVAVNGRPRFPSAPSDFFGNFVLNVFPSTKAEDLLGGTLADSAELIRDSVKQVEESYIQSFIDFGELNKGEVLEPFLDQQNPSLLPNLEVDSWLGFSFNSLDFGYGGQCGFSPSWLPYEGLVLLVPSSNGDDKNGVDVIVTLFKDHAKIFREICFLVD